MVDPLLDGRRPRGHTASIGQRVDDELAGHTRHRFLARGVDIRDRDVVGCRERRAELRRQVARPRVEVRLEEHAEATAGKSLSHGGDRRCDLGRVMAVVVDHRDAVDLGDLEAPAGAGELREDRRSLVALDTGELERGERRAGVAAVVLSGQRELAFVGRRVPYV